MQMVNTGESIKNHDTQLNSRRTAFTKDIEAQEAPVLAWDNSALEGSLARLHDYVVTEAIRSEKWYWAKKAPKAWWSRLIQFSSITLAALAGVFPIVARLELFPQFFESLKLGGYIGHVETGLWSSCFLGIAAALMGLDRFFGFSSGWARYVLTGSTIRRTLEEFRMDWTLLVAQLGSAPTPTQVAAVINRAKDFRMAVEGLVLKETQDWVTEFQNNIAQMEKELRVQVDRMKADSEKVAQAQALANLPGSLEATIADAEKTDNFRFEALLENRDGVVARETVSNSRTWVKLDTPPGQYKLTVTATASGKPRSISAVVVVKPNEIAKPALTMSP